MTEARQAFEDMVEVSTRDEMWRLFRDSDASLMFVWRDEVWETRNVEGVKVDHCTSRFYVKVDLRASRRVTR